MDIRISVKISEKDLLEKLDILRLEKGINMSSFITAAIAEKLKREGYIEKIKLHKRGERSILLNETKLNKKTKKRKKQEIDDLLERLQDITIHRYD